jgi:hypothetical protein
MTTSRRARSCGGAPVCCPLAVFCSASIAAASVFACINRATSMPN